MSNKLVLLHLAVLQFYSFTRLEVIMNQNGVLLFWTPGCLHSSETKSVKNNQIC